MTDTPEKKKWNYRAKLHDAKQRLAAAQTTASNKFAVAKQAMLEKTGKIEQTSEDSELTEYCERIEETRMMLKQIYKAAKQGTVTSHGANNDFRLLTKNIAQFASRTEMDNPDLSKALRKVADVQIRLLTLSDSYLAEFNARFSVPLQDHVKQQVRDARYYKKDVYDRRRVEFDATLARKQSGKLQMTDADFEQLKAEFEELAHETLENVRSVDEEKDSTILKTFCTLIEQQHHYHHQSYMLLEQLKPFVKEMHERAEEKRMEHLQAKQKREKERAEKLRLTQPAPDHTRIFGRPLDEVLTKEGGVAVPQIMTKGFARLLRSFDEEGLYRLSGQKSVIDRLKNQIDRQDPWTLDDVDPHVTTGLVKMFLRELPEPLLTFGLFDDFLGSQAIQDPTERVAKLKSLVSALPAANQTSLQALMEHLHSVKEQSDVNKMGASNLAVVFGPNLLKRSNDDFGTYEESLHSNNVIESLITYAPQIFGSAAMPSQPSPATAPQNLLLDFDDDDAMMATQATTSFGGFSMGSHDDDFNPRADMSDTSSIA